jgi:SAM-dependent methyltransferase
VSTVLPGELIAAEPLPSTDAAEPFARFAEQLDVNWSDDLEALHEESSRDHFIDVWTRTALLDAIAGSVPEGGVIADVGCSTGYLLEDLRRAYPSATLVGLDLVAAGLHKAHRLVPSASLLLADVTALPFADASVDAIVSANVLEHVPDDEAALRELRRVLRPGARAALIVPAGPGLYDYYDKLLGHERRYSRGELAGKARDAGFDVVRDAYIGSLIFPAFWAKKKLDRRRHSDPSHEEIQRLVQQDIATTQGSRVGTLTARAERALLRRGIALPFGVRSYVVVQRP